MRDTPPVTAVAHPNIALVKYWGKRDEDLVLPLADSLSLTLDVFPTTTSVRLCPAAARDTVVVDGQPATGEMLRRITGFLDLVRALARRREPARVDTRNTVPVGAGLASSAAGFAALALAAAGAYEVTLDPTALSRLARRGSGSAARSVFGGFVQWYAGPPGADDADLASYAEPLNDARLDPAMIAVLLRTGPKPVSSREAMRRTVATSPLFPGWLAATRTDITAMRTALAEGDLAAAGAIAERNALGMHATMETATPPVNYRTQGSRHVLEHVRRMRDRGEQTWSTMDAGPNVKVLCPAADAQRIAAELGEITGCPTVVARPGPGARMTTGMCP
ncbi:diphosphomevalonate decarboxylase [Streptomyces qinzhouensis]|uniref:diphosphomevalonate decarboxylase n=1 Tax=Streptomyces qinzhouensis TaxID=2599401 RepID=A0A5B8JJ05_9ACTN|nr:diphosphomevalonate decarboxylase [Streptomyces qinzhouensis]QDY80394.1 diphosphomevalonate decarboxylase [Streptomyces qinzhouensis]